MLATHGFCTFEDMADEFNFKEYVIQYDWTAQSETKHVSTT